MNLNNSEFMRIAKQIGMTDTDLGHALGVSSVTVYRWRTNRSPVRRGIIEAVKRIKEMEERKASK